MNSGPSVWYTDALPTELRRLVRIIAFRTSTTQLAERFGVRLPMPHCGVSIFDRNLKSGGSLLITSLVEVDSRSFMIALEENAHYVTESALALCRFIIK